MQKSPQIKHSEFTSLCEYHRNLDIQSDSVLILAGNTEKKSRITSSQEKTYSTFLCYLHYVLPDNKDFDFKYRFLSTNYYLILCQQFEKAFGLLANMDITVLRNSETVL